MITIKQNKLKPKKILGLFLTNKYSDGMKREYIFHPTRKWRFDYAWPDKKIAIEFEGGTFIRGGHTRGAGYAKNCEKYNQAALLGWKVYRFTPDMMRISVRSADFIKIAMNQ